MDNPYAAPAAELQNPTELELAGRGQRLGAAVIDSLIAMTVIIPVMFFFGLFGEETKMSFLTNVSLVILNIAVFIAVHGYSLKTSGQTVGKRLLGIRIVGLDGQLRPLPDLILKRYIPISLAGVVPVVGSFLPLLDVILIFRNDRRCAHDFLAGTQVVKV